MKRTLASRTLPSTRSKLLAAISSVMAIAFLAVLLPTTASATGPGGSTSTLNGGVLRLHLGAEDYFKFQRPAGSGYTDVNSLQQSIGVGSGCRIALAGSPAPSLATFSPPSTGNSNPYTGFVGDSIGVGSKNEGNGQPCGRIDPTQTLTMDLGPGLPNKFIDYAEIDLELKYSASVTISGFLNETLVGAPVLYSSAGSDSGPDSGDLDNYRVRYPKTGTTKVNRLVVNIIGSTGTASLEGGADGTEPCDPADPGECGPVNSSLGQTLGNTTDTLFHLIEVDGVLNCNQTAPSQGGNGTPTNTLTRLDNVGGGTCTPIPYNLDSSVANCEQDFHQCVLLQKDLLGQIAQFYWTVTWAPETGQYMETETEFDFGFGFQKLQLCLADDGDADTFPELPPKAADSPAGSPDPDPWCVVETSTVLNAGTGLVVVTEKYFGSGDPGGHR